MPGTMPGSSVLEFYNDAKIFITGGTGFLGKVLIEKFLRCCPNFNHIYILVRTKKGKDPQERLKELFDCPLFQGLRKEKPDFDKKITCIPGDVAYEKLNMSENDYEFLVNEVTHVFHSAATVRFNEKLKKAIDINVLGTQEMLNFCNKCIHLKVFVHISTAYAHCVRDEIGEEYYDPPLTGTKALELVKTLSEEQLESVTEELIKPWPNTYSYTKSIAESIVREKGCTIPALIFRPGIVMGTYKEPITGWIDNIYGPTGVIAAAGVGLMRVLYGDGTTLANVIPVDLTVNGMLSCAWEVGSNSNNNSVIENSLTESKDGSEFSKRTRNEPEIYNFVVDESNVLSWNDIIDMTLRLGVDVPSPQAIWYYTLTITRHKILFLLATLLYHYIPGLLGDGVLILLGKKPQMWKAYQKIYMFTIMMSTFALQRWRFGHDNMKRVCSRLSEADKALFECDMAKLNWQQYFPHIVSGIRRYILKDSEQSLPAAKRKMLFLWFAHRTLQCLFIAFVFWILSKLFF